VEVGEDGENAEDERDSNRKPESPALAGSEEQGGQRQEIRKPQPGDQRGSADSDSTPAGVPG